MPSRATISLIRSLQQRKFRNAEKSFIVEGPKLVEELLRSSFHTRKVYALESWIPSQQNDLPEIEIITERELEQISALHTPNKVLAVAEMPESKEVIMPDKGLHLIISQIQDPGNFGTIIRIADWFGISGLICSEDTVEVYNPKVVQATMGSIFRVPVFYTDLQKFLSEKNELPVYGTTLDGESVYDNPLSEDGLIILGNESKGLTTDLSGHLNIKLMIPAASKNSDHAESLNVSVACGIICSEFRRRYPK